MTFEEFREMAGEFRGMVSEILIDPETYIQISLIVAIYASAFLISNRLRKFIPFLDVKPEQLLNNPLPIFLDKLSNLVFPLSAILLLRISVELLQNILPSGWIMQTALTIAVLLLTWSLITTFVKNKTAVRLMPWVLMPLVFMQMVGLLGRLINIMESIALNVGNLEISAYGVLRVTLFGSLLFWMGRVSNNSAKELIRRQEQLDFRTREVAAKLLEVVIFVITSLLLLQVMGINLTALAVFGGAVGVGLGFGLQAIASNFISGIILLLDRSLSLGDYVELDDGRTGVVSALNLRSTTLESFDGKDIIVPNEKFIVEPFTNWTHKNHKQRYRVDFSVSYSTNVRKLVELIKEVVASHPQVLSGEKVPFEERPDCEIDSFGDSGINMFVEFWMEGIDDGKNRVGGDLNLMILEALQEHGYEIPFPQREVRVLKT